MANKYMYGVYGELRKSIARSAIQSGSVAVYVGTAPVHLVRDYKEKNLVNMPVKLINYLNAQENMGYSKDWDSYTICEAMDAHFNNPIQNVGPIYVINVFDPDTMRPKAEEIVKTVELSGMKIFIEDNGMVKNTIKISGYENGEDFEIVYSPDGAEISFYEELQQNIELSYMAVDPTEQTLVFVNGMCEIQSTTIILDTLALNGLIEGVDYSVDYDFAKGKVLLYSLGSENPIEGNVESVYFEVESNLVTKEDIIGGRTANGVVSGLHAIKLVYQETNAIPTYLSVPKWSVFPEVFNTMASVAQNINGHWNAFFNADLPLESGNKKVDTREKAVNWKKVNGYRNERGKVCWPKYELSDGRIFHISTLTTWLMLQVDFTHDSIPFETPANKELPPGRPYYGKYSTNRGYDQEECNEITSWGITTAMYDAGKWVLWGDHTSAYSYGGELDPRGIFDSNIRMLLYLINQFQLRWKNTIDQPMTIGLKDTILNTEQTILDSLKGRGALLGNPKIMFLEEHNDIVDLMNGVFYWDIHATPTPPFKSGIVGVSYTDEGFSSYIDGGVSQ